MLFYIVIIAISVFLYKLAEHSGKFFVFFLAAIPPILIEGLRAESIGTDMDTYVVPYFDTLSKADNVMEVTELINHSDYAYLYLTYFCAKYLGDLNVFLLLCATLKLVPVYWAAYQQREKLNTTLFVIAYFLYYYVLGFSMMRQSMAISFTFLSLYYFFEKQFFKYLLWLLVAYFFHNSAILMLYLPIVFYMGKMKYRYLFSVIIPLLIFAKIKEIMEAFITSPLFTEGKVEYYMDSGVPSEKTSLVIASFIALFGMIMLIKYFIVYWNTTKNTEESEGQEDNTYIEDQGIIEASTVSEDVENQTVCSSLQLDRIYLLLTSIAFALIFLLLASYIEVAFRMSYYMLNVAIVMALFIMNSEKSLLYNLGFLSVFILHFVILSINGFNDTVPYHSIIFGI